MAKIYSAILLFAFCCQIVLMGNVPENSAVSEVSQDSAEDSLIQQDASTDSEERSTLRKRSCRYWCQRPDMSYYCCMYGDAPIKPIQVHPGHCPCHCLPMGASCPVYIMAPPHCAHDGDCPKAQKCCYDSCIAYHTCKPVEFRTP